MSAKCAGSGFRLFTKLTRSVMLAVRAASFAAIQLPTEKAALIAFLKTLTDEKFLSDPKFSDPFK